MIIIRNFTSGITGDNHFIISMDDYTERDVKTCWELSSGYHKLSRTASIDINDYDEKYLTVKWKGNIFYPTTHDERVRNSVKVRIYCINNNDVDVLNNKEN